MQLELLHPEVAGRSCELCIQNVFHEDGPLIGQIQVGADGNPMRRPPGTRPPCRRQSMSCPKGTPEKPIELTPENREAWEFYKRCKLTGRWPDDEIVMEMGILLDEIYQYVDQMRQMEFMATLVGVRS